MQVQLKKGKVSCGRSVDVKKLQRGGEGKLRNVRWSIEGNVKSTTGENENQLQKQVN